MYITYIVLVHFYQLINNHVYNSYGTLFLHFIWHDVSIRRFESGEYTSPRLYPSVGY